MVYKIVDIVRDVRIAIDENKTGEQLIADEDIETLSVEELIRSKVADAVRAVVNEAPFHLLDGGLPFGEDVYWRGNGCGWTLLPDDFMRLVVFKMSDWERPVHEPVTASDPRYLLQFSRYRGLRGNPQKPVAAVVSRAEGFALEFFSCRSESATVEQAVYYPEPRVDQDGGIDIPWRCYRPVVYMTGALVLATLGQVDMSTVMTEQSRQFLK